MLRIDVICDEPKMNLVFRTNNDGFYLFTGVAENKQISCKSGFNSMRRVKKFIREFLAYRHELKTGEKLSRLTYSFSGSGNWES